MIVLPAPATERSWFFNTSERSWSRTPYMLKDYSVLSECRNYLATVVIIAKESTKKRKDGTETSGLDFIPMGVRIECVTARQRKDGYTLPGWTYFIKRKTQVISETPYWTFQTNRLGALVMEMHRPLLNKPRKDSKTESIPFTDHKDYGLLKPLVERAWEEYEYYRAEARAAA